MTTEARLDAILDDVQRALADIITRHRVTAEEFRAATEFLAEAGQQHLDIPLLLVGAVKKSLITKLSRHDDYATCSYDFVLPEARATH